MKKKQACQMIAGVVSICAILCIMSTVKAFMQVRAVGGSFPMGMILLSLMTVVCTILIWNGVRNMDE